MSISFGIKAGSKRKAAAAITAFSDVDIEGELELSDEQKLSQSKILQVLRVCVPHMLVRQLCLRERM